MVSARLVWHKEPITLIPPLGEYGKRLHEAVRVLLEVYAARIEAYAKQHARWKDITGAARQGLRAFVVEVAGGFILYLVHSVFYGIFLELKNAQRFAIIEQTLETFYGPLMVALKRLANG